VLWRAEHGEGTEWPTKCSKGNNVEEKPLQKGRLQGGHSAAGSLSVKVMAAQGGSHLWVWLEDRCKEGNQ
jgi:hypothetical protein